MTTPQITETAIVVLQQLNNTFASDPISRSEDIAEQRFLERFSTLEFSGNQEYSKASRFTPILVKSVVFCTAGLRYEENPQVKIWEMLTEFKKSIEVEIGKASQEAGSISLVATGKPAIYGEFRLIVTPERFFQYECKCNLAFVI